MKKILLIIALFVCAGAWAVPARRDGFVRVAADGTEKTVYLHGDAFFHYMTDENGVWLDEETLLPLDETAKNERLAVREQRAQRRAVRSTGVDTLLAPRGPVILVSYKDQAFQQTNEQMTEWAMGDNYTADGGTGSVRQYFHDVSNGKYNLDIDVIGPVTVSQNASYYGRNTGGRATDANPKGLIREACQLAAQLPGVDFSKYDYNNDGEVDWVVVLFAGKGENDGGGNDAIWPHQDDLGSSSITLNGKTIDHYCCLAEIDGVTNIRCGIGVFVHEFGHIMGLPDLYSTDDNATHKTSGMWDIMDYGCYNNDCNTPPAYSAYERWFMGWITPTLLNTAANVHLDELNATQAAGYINTSGQTISSGLRPNPNVFYTFENRQQSGWDTYLPGHGLIITKINYKYNWWSGNTVNYSEGSLGVDIIEADGLTPHYDKNNRTNGWFGKQGDAYPYGTTTSFTQVSNYQVTDIEEANGIITFKINGGGPTIVLDVENTEQPQRAQKILRDGQVIIVRGGKIYTITGLLLNK